MSFCASFPQMHLTLHILSTYVNLTLTPSKAAKVTYNYKWHFRLKGHTNDLELNAHMQMQFSKSLCGRSEDGLQIQTRKA